LYGKNKNYLSKLSQRLGEEDRLQVFIFTEEEQIYSVGLDYLIVEEEEKLSIYELSNRKEVVLCIDKYQSSKQIITKILEFLGISKGNLQDTDSMKEVIGVYSPASRAFKTSLAVILGYHQKDSALFISLDKFSVLKSHQNENEIYDFSDILYYLSQGNLEESMIVQSIDYMHELSYIHPPSSPEDIHKITVSQLKKVIEVVSNRFSKIILDIGNDINDTVEILQLCEIIYLPTISDGYIEEKNKKFIEYLQGRGEEELLRKIKPIEIPMTLVTNSKWDFSYYEQLKWSDFVFEN
jgi:hypothetical protein